MDTNREISDFYKGFPLTLEEVMIKAVRRCFYDCVWDEPGTLILNEETMRDLADKIIKSIKNTMFITEDTANMPYGICVDKVLAAGIDVKSFLDKK